MHFLSAFNKILTEVPKKLVYWLVSPSPTSKTGLGWVTCMHCQTYIFWTLKLGHYRDLFANNNNKFEDPTAKI